MARREAGPDQPAEAERMPERMPGSGGRTAAEEALQKDLLSLHPNTVLNPKYVMNAPQSDGASS
ncbi:hypothetical protein DMH02_004310 [Streptomyces sp. WAC 00631]|uniref:hypothetical protein n=1 Tax=Streptomyces sp. WAC 00631 TaxID=2203201 RepID=UPI000F77E2A2|nr:hypothetical protein [Streptomyces sp. WAC 00631]MCC5032494.1 hypothetical protein [Streptomyces sp. WAC 00631]